MFPERHKIEGSARLLPNPHQIHKKIDASSLVSLLLLVSLICAGSDNDAVLHQHAHHNRSQAI
jgi:hypothetical protein